MKYIKIILATLSIILITGFISPVVSATSPTDVACNAISTTVSTSGCSNGNNVILSIVHDVVYILSLLIGAVSVIMIIVAGFRYVVAGDDANAVKSAKDTLIYALIGLAIAVLAQFLVHTVINTANNVRSSSYLNTESAITYDG